MRKYFVLSSVLALTACAGGGGESGLMGAFNTDTPRAAFAGTPSAVRSANAPFKQETVFNFTGRLLAIYDAADMQIADDVVLPELPTDGVGVKADIINSLSDADKLKLRKVMYIMDKINGIYHDFGYKSAPNMANYDLVNVAKWINAFYDIESKGQITNLLNVDAASNITDESELHEYLKPVDMDIVRWTYDEPVILADGFFKVDSNGNITGINYGLNGVLGRVGNTNVFEGEIANPLAVRTVEPDTINAKVTLESAAGGKLSYYDFGFATEERKNTDDVLLSRAKGVYASFSGKQGEPGRISANYPDADFNWNFKGTAVGVYTKASNGTVDTLPYTTTMKTNNATLNIAGTDATNITTTLNMPFSESGWYDVKVTSLPNNNAGGWFIPAPFGGNATIEFSNFKGDESKRLSADNSGTVTASATLTGAAAAEHIFTQPEEVVGRVRLFNLGSMRAAPQQTETFEAAFGMKKQ